MSRNQIKEMTNFLQSNLSIWKYIIAARVFELLSQDPSRKTYYTEHYKRITKNNTLKNIKHQIDECVK